MFNLKVINKFSLCKCLSASRMLLALLANFQASQVYVHCKSCLDIWISTLEGLQAHAVTPVVIAAVVSPNTEPSIICCACLGNQYLLQARATSSDVLTNNPATV